VETVRTAETATARVFPYPHLGISVLSVVLLPQNGEKTTCTRENWRNGRQRIFIPSRSYANLDRTSSQENAATVPREYINFASSGNCTLPAPFPKLPSLSSFLLRCFVPSVTKMNKAHFVSSRTIPSVFLGALIKMTRLVRPCQFFLALTGTSMDGSEGAEREKNDKLCVVY